MTTPSPGSLKMAKLNLFLLYWNMIIFCNFHLNLNHFHIVCHKATSKENVMGFQIQIWLPVMKQDIISFMSTVEDTGTKHMFIMHFGRHNLIYCDLLWKSGHLLLPLWQYFFGRHNWIGRLTIYKLSYEILDCDLLWKSGHLLLPLWQYFFQHTVPTATH